MISQPRFGFWMRAMLSSYGIQIPAEVDSESFAAQYCTDLATLDLAIARLSDQQAVLAYAQAQYAAAGVTDTVLEEQLARVAGDIALPEPPADPEDPPAEGE